MIKVDLVFLVTLSHFILISCCSHFNGRSVVNLDLKKKKNEKLSHKLKLLPFRIPTTFQLLLIGNK